MAAADARDERRDRSVSTDRAKIADHARLPRSAREVSQSCGDHHKEPSRHARYRSFARARGVNAAAVNVSVTSLDPTLQRVLEPRTTSPQGRLDAIEQLRAAKIPVGVMVAPIIPGLTDHEVPKILDACAKAGAQFAGYTIVRLPWAVAPLFEHWLEEHFPERKEKVLRRIRHLRGNRLNNSQWHTRMTGEGIFAEQIASLFRVGCRHAGIGERPTLSCNHFADRRPNCGSLHKHRWR